MGRAAMTRVAEITRDETAERAWYLEAEELPGELFPYSAASPELLDRIAEFLVGPDIDPALARVMIEGRDVAEKALRSRALPS